MILINTTYDVRFDKKCSKIIVYYKTMIRINVSFHYYWRSSLKVWLCLSQTTGKTIFRNECEQNFGFCFSKNLFHNELKKEEK